MPDMTCPKCQSPMRSYERSGVTVDQCTGCRGVFLDRGELERLVDAEGSFYEQKFSPQPAPPSQPSAREPAWHAPEPRHYEHGHHQHGHHKRHKRRESFLGDLFDF